MLPWVAIASHELSAAIDPLGAQLSLLRDAAGRDLLWDGDAAVWAGRAPLLFPIIGTLAGGSYRLDDRQFALPRHGFARGRRFELLEAGDSSALFRLSADPATLEVYPFEFQLDVQFAIAGSELAVTATVRNTGTARMPASLGFHPGFRWPLPYGQPRAAHYIEFESDEPGPARRITSGGLLRPAAVATPVEGRRLPLTDSLFEEDVIIFDTLRSRALTYGAATGPRLRISFPDATHLGIWTKPGAQFVCIEPWQGITDPDGFNGDMRRKPGVFLVAPGATHSLRMLITL